MLINQSLLGLTILAVAGSATAQQVVTFSFASDDNSNAPSFVGSAGSSVSDSGFADQSYSLLVDDFNGPLPSVSYDELNLDVNFSIEAVTKVEIAPGLFNHQYTLAGGFSLVEEDTGSAVLNADISGAVVSILGTRDSWFTSGAVVSTDLDSAEITYTWLGDTLSEYGLFSGESSIIDGIDDGVFTLSAIRGEQGASVQLGADDLPVEAWSAEGSFSGSAVFVPAPGTIGLLAGAGLIATRRRR